MRLEWSREFRHTTSFIGRLSDPSQITNARTLFRFPIIGKIEACLSFRFLPLLLLLGHECPPFPPMVNESPLSGAAISG